MALRHVPENIIKHVILKGRRHQIFLADIIWHGGVASNKRSLIFLP